MSLYLLMSWYIWCGSAFLMAILAVRLLATDLWRRYPAFTLYIVALCIESGVLFAFDHKPALYGRIWIFSRMVVLLLETAVVLTIFGRWTVSFPGIGKFGRSLFFVLMAASVGVALSTLPVAWSNGGWRVAYQLTTIANRGANACFAIFLLLAIGFFSKFGGPVAPNLKRHSWCMAVFVTASTVSYFVLSSHLFVLANILLPSVSLVALAFWIFAFRKSGERQPATAPNENESAVAEEMNRQLVNLAGSVKLSPRGLKKRK